MFLDKKIFKNLDYSIIISIFLLVFIGLLTISSATRVYLGGTPRYVISQAVWFLVSICVGIIILNIDYNSIGGYYKILYIISIILLILVLLIGSERNGAKAWLGIGPFGGQPSELAKIATIITIAKLLEDMENINSLKNLGKLAFVAILPMALIQLQPDLGTNLIFAVTIFGMLFTAGLDKRIIYGGIVSLATSVIAVWELGILKSYQKDRILVFFRPELDRLGSGYNAYVAKTAIGSGKFFGMGLFNGIQSSGNFIPESHTDFIFCVFAEEWGFLGAVVLLVLFLNIILKSINIASTSKDKFGKYLTIGIITMITFQVLQNIGMDIGLMPITGIPLPFISYGGSSLLTTVVSISLILNVGARRKKINF